MDADSSLAELPAEKGMRSLHCDGHTAGPHKWWFVVTIIVVVIES